MNKNKTNINWARRILAKQPQNLHKINTFKIILFEYLEKRRRINVYKEENNLDKSFKEIFENIKNIIP